MERLGLSHIDVLAIDTEGNDPAVLFGARRALRERRVSLIEYEHQFLGLWATVPHRVVVDWLDDMGYDCYWLGQSVLWRITGCWDDRYNLRKWSNVMCVLREHPWRGVLEALSFRA